MMRKALITGVNGQDGSYLAELLLAKGYRLVGTVGGPDTSLACIDHIADRIEIEELDLTDGAGIESMVRRHRPSEFYNLAARASSAELWTDPIGMAESNGVAVARILEAIRSASHETRFCQACSSEVFGHATEVSQTESTPFHPRNPYGVAKAFGHWITTVYREQRGLFACSCILYNHESPRRRTEFVTRKISHGAAMIKLGQANVLRLGALDARRDWGFAGDYVQAMWLSLQHSVPGDYIVATGKTHSVREFCEIAFSHVGLKYEDYVVQDRENVRSAEAVSLVGNPAKAKRILGWTPTVDFTQLVTMMVDADLRMLGASDGTRCPSS